MRKSIGSGLLGLLLTTVGTSRAEEDSNQGKIVFTCDSDRAKNSNIHQFVRDNLRDKLAKITAFARREWKKAEPRGKEGTVIYTSPSTNYSAKICLDDDGKSFRGFIYSGPDFGASKRILIKDSIVNDVGIGYNSRMTIGKEVVYIDTYNGQAPTLKQVLNINLNEYPRVLDMIMQQEKVLEKNEEWRKSLLKDQKPPKKPDLKPKKNTRYTV